MQISEQSVTWPFSTDLMQFIFSNTLFFPISDDGFKWESRFFGNCIEFYDSFVRKASFHDSVLPSLQDEVKFHSCAMKPAVRKKKISTMPHVCAE